LMLRGLMPLPDIAERLTVVLCRSWPVVGCGYQPHDVAAVVVANRVVAPSLGAEHLGVVAGLRRREAQRRAPGLIVLSPDLAAEARAFEPVLRVLDDLTPRIEIDQPGQCSFLTRGPSRYFGGDQAMSERAARVIADAIEGSTSVHVGTADGRFAALRAAALAEPNRARVVPAGASAAFLSALPIGLLAADDRVPVKRKQLEDLVDVLSRLGLTSLGAFADLEASDVIARFGAVGVRAHLWARGRDDRPASPEEPPAELEVAIDLEPPVLRVDQAAFVAKALAEEFIRKLSARGISCARVAIGAETEHGESQLRLWRSEEAFSAPAISDRMRWQLDGWLSGPVRLRPTGGLSRLVIRPDDISVAAGRQLGFWGEQTGLAERAARSVARVQGIVGIGVARVPEVRGGRSAGDRVVSIAVESVDLVERSTAPDRKAGAQTASAIAGVAAEGVLVDGVAQRWTGEMPAPAPTTVHSSPIMIDVLDANEQLVRVSSRGIMVAEPAWVVLARQAPLAIDGWSGPWLLDEWWWQPERRRRQVRMQLALADGRAVIATCQQGQWAIVASYD
jgi:protein ImuB